MWDTFKASVIGVDFLRRFIIASAAFIVAVLFVITNLTGTALAVPLGDTITHDGTQYTRSQLTLPGTDADSKVYTVPQADQQTECPRTENVLIASGEADENGAAAARKVAYTVDCDGNYSNPTNAQTVTVTSTTTGDNGDGNTAEQTSCAVKGIGWIVCSVSRFMADSMDRIYGWVSDYLTVKPLSTDTESPLFQAWKIARGIANAMFIIAFLVVIYSYITNQGVSNYDIKKIAPRLIIVAFLVNISYYIAALAVDVSNILGDSIAVALTEIRNSLPTPNPEGALFNKGGLWSIVTAFVLSGGTIAAAGMTAFSGAAVGGSIAALATLLFPILIAGALSALVALLILAARQALITVLVVISPLAFVAFMLPNTEKYFSKWKDLFLKMLMIFPMFSLLFGGSQLASFIVMQNTDKISVVILALFIQVAPLALTPFLVQFSGSLLGKLAGMLNDPKKGVIDRSRSWSKERAEAHAKRRMAAGAMRPAYTPSGLSYRRARSKRNFENHKKLYETKFESALANDTKLHEAQAETKLHEVRKSTGEAMVDRRFEQMKQHDYRAQNIVGVNRLEQAQLKAMQTANDARWEEAVSNSGNLPPDNPYTQFAVKANAAYKAQRIADSNVTMAKQEQSNAYAIELSDAANIDLQIKAGGIGKHGDIKVKAAAMSELVQEGLKNVKAIQDASHVKAGDVGSMKIEFDKAVANNDVDSLRAYANMMSESSDVGIKALRDMINKHHAAIKASDMHETFMHAINSNGTINNSAKDIADYSRDSEAGYRKLEDVTRDYATWKNVSAVQLSQQKASTQQHALLSMSSDGKWAITTEQAKAIVKSQAFESFKPEVKKLMTARAHGRLKRVKRVIDGDEVYFPKIEDDIPPIPDGGFSPRRS